MVKLNTGELHLAMHPNEPFSPVLAALTAPGYLGLIVDAIVAPFRMRGSWLRLAPLATITAWTFVAFAPLAAAGLAPLLGLLAAAWAIFALGSLSICGPCIYVRFLAPVQQVSLSNP